MELSVRQEPHVVNDLVKSWFSQAQGKVYLRIDPLGEGAKWRRSFGQEIYSPFLLAVTEQVREQPRKCSCSSWGNFLNSNKWLFIILQDTNINVPIFKGMEPSYSLPDNVAMITLQVFTCTLNDLASMVHSIGGCALLKHLVLYHCSEYCRNLKMEKFSFGWHTYTRSFYSSH